MCNAVFRTPFSRCPLDGTKLAELDGDPLVGTVLDKRYVIEECIGEGGMGRVYRAKHTRMSRHYAIKILFGDHAGDTRMRSRFAREAEAVSRLNHANVISVVDFGETEEGLLYLVMDLADGESLAHLVHREAPLEAGRTIEILARMAKGLAHAHNHGLVHRDFKCENVIMVTEEAAEVPKIVDFGICMIVEDAPAATMLTSNGMIMGTPAVMAPEQASGDKVDHRTDLFSLGIVGYQMLSGCLPFEGTPLEMARKNLYEDIPSVLERCGLHVDPGLEAVIHRLTAKNPDDRYQDAREVLEALKLLDLSASFDSWTNATPLPTQLPQGLPTPAPRHQSDNPELTEAVSPYHLEAGLQLGQHAPDAKRKMGLIAFAGVAVATVLLVYVLATSGGDSKKTPETGELAAAGLPAEAGQDGGPDESIEPAAVLYDAGVEVVAVVPDAAEETKMDPDVVPTNPKPKAQETPRERKRRLAAEERRLFKQRKADRKAAAALRNKNNSSSDAADAAQRRRAAVKVYDGINLDLDVLDKLRGANASLRFRRIFKNFHRTRLLTDTKYADEKKKALRSLQMQIKRRKQSK